MEAMGEDIAALTDLEGPTTHTTVPVMVGVEALGVETLGVEALGVEALGLEATHVPQVDPISWE